MCGPKGYGFSAVLVINRVSIIAILPGLKQGPGGVLPKKLGRDVRPASQNPYPIYDQNLRFMTWRKFDTLFMTWPLNHFSCFRPAL